MMSLKKNILANYVGTGIAGIAPLLALPWYIQALGHKQFGLIAFIVMLQTLLSLLDAGMSQALVREFAIRLDGSGQGRRNAAALLLGFERIYWLFAVFAAGITALVANVITTHWLNLNGLSISTGVLAIYGAAAIFLVQFPGSVYRSLLVGAQAQVSLNGILSISAIVRHLGGVIVVLIWPSLITYLIWHTTIALIDSIIRSHFAWKTLELKRTELKWDFQEITAIWKTTLSLSASALLGALTVQMDKIILSRMVPIEQFGYYSVASTLANVVLQFAYPVYQAITPQLINLRNDVNKLQALNLNLLKITFVFIVFSGLFYGFFGDYIIDFWLKNKLMASVVYPLSEVLLMGTAFNMLYNIGYMNWLANFKTNKIFTVNIISFILSILLMVWLVSLYGLYGATFSWLSINLIGLIYSLDWFFKKQKDEK